MDNVTHTLFALTLARTRLGRAGRGTTAALVLASNAPDIDVVTTLGGADRYLTWHRGPTHGPLGIAGLGVVVAALVWLALRVVGRRSREAAQDSSPALLKPPRESGARFGALVPICILGVLCHVLLDVPTPYGTQMLSPFDWHWFSLDWMPIIDVYLLATLAAGLVFGSGSALAKQRNVAIVFSLMALNYGVRVVAHHEALAIAPRLFGPLLPQPCDPTAGPAAPVIEYWPRALTMNPRDSSRRCLVQLVANPTFISPLHWQVIAQLSNAYEMQTISLLDRRFWQPPDEPEVLWRRTVRVPNLWTPSVQAAASTRLAQTFLGFARLPAARSFSDQSGVTTVRWGDLRFTGARMALAPPQNDPFSILVRVGPDGQVLEEHLGP